MTSDPPRSAAAEADGDSLDALDRRAWRDLRTAADRRAGDFQTAVMATLGLDGSPRLRCLVLRDATVAGRRLTFHTDIRSAKVGEIAGRPHVEVLFWDRSSGVQLRCRGTAFVLTPDDPATRAALDALPPAARTKYRIGPTPGDAIASPADAQPAEADPADDPARRVFAILQVAVDRMDHLTVDGARQRRALFRYRDGDLAEAGWIVP